MGVNQLWNILEPVRRKENLSALRNKTLCVDLSGWICEARCAKGLKQNVSKPHLRNLFFRLLHLTRLGVKLVFVVDGEPPELKWEAIAKRIQARNGGQNWRAKNSQKTGSGARVGRSHFAVWVRECCTLLNLLGIPCIESGGEAEALCAWLDLHQIVDGCITNDGDAFLYGARVVYKDLCISGKDASVECYKMEEIESQLNLNRQTLVALGILLGCDYLPQGVSGVGKEIAMKLIRSVNHDNLIDRFYEWTKGTCRDENLSSIEKSVKCKALKDQSFPHPKVIQEFLAPKVVPQRVSLKIMSPDLQGLQEFCLKNLEWPEEYTRDKVLLLITYWQMTSSLQHHTTTLVQPERIVKARIQQKVECYEVEWQNVELGEACPTSFVTIETRELFNQAYPDFVEEFNNTVAAKLAKKSRKKKGDKPSTSNDCESDMDLLSQQLKDLSVHQSSDYCHASAIQKEKPVTGNICTDESLQDIIDSILPSISGHKSHSLGNCSPFARVNDDNGNVFASGITGGDIYSNNDGDDDDDEDKDENEDDDDDHNNGGSGDDIPCDFKPLEMDVMTATMKHEELCIKSTDDYHVSERQAVEVNPDALGCDDSNDDASDDKRSGVVLDKPLVSLGTKKPAEFKPISWRGSLIIVDSSDDEEDGCHGNKPLLKESLKATKTKGKAVLNDADLNEIFGSSNLWSSDTDDEEAKDSHEPRKSFVINPSSIIEVKTAPHMAKRLDDVRDYSQQKSLQNANAHFPCDTDVNNFLNPEFENVGSKNSVNKGCLSNVLQDVSRGKLNTITRKNDLHRGTDSKKSEEPVRDPSHSTFESPVHYFNTVSQKTAQCDSVNDVNTCEIRQKQQYWKENADSPFDDFMPAPLSKRLGKHFSAKQRLASLRSISTTTEDI